MPAYEPYVQKFIQRFAEGVCVDVGAGTGFHTRVMLRVPWVREVHAFEPVPFNFAKLLAINDPRLRVYPIALGELEGELEMVAHSLVKPKFGWVNARKPFRNDPSLKECRVKFRVPMKRLDSILSRVDFIKVDVEGMEFQVLKGCGDAIRKAYIVVELHGWGEYDQKELIKYLERTHRLTSPWREGYVLQHLYFVPK